MKRALNHKNTVFSVHYWIAAPELDIGQVWILNMIEVDPTCLVVEQDRKDQSF